MILLWFYFPMRLKIKEDADVHIRTWQGEKDYELLELGAKQNKKIWEILNRVLYQRRFAFFMPHDAYEIPQVMDICVWQETDRPYHVNLFLSYDLDRNGTVMIGDTEYALMNRKEIIEELVKVLKDGENVRTEAGSKMGG